MKFSLLLILPCFLTISAASFGSFAAFEGASFSNTETSATMVNAQEPSDDNARRGSGRREPIIASTHVPNSTNARRGSGRRAVLAHSLIYGKSV